MYPTPRILPNGDCALSVEFAAGIDPAAADAVLALDRAIASAAITGIAETVPTYRALLVCFDPILIRRAALVERLSAILTASTATGGRATRRWRIPVAFGGDHGADLGIVAASAGLSEDTVVDLYLAATYRVAMIGFAPGFAYLSGLDPRLATGRRSEPRASTPACSISIGGVQTAVSPPLSLPSGWQLIGRTPVRSFDLSREAPFLFEAGDEIVFEQIEAGIHDALAARAAAGEPIATCEAV